MNILQDSTIFYFVKTDLNGLYTYISPYFSQRFNFLPEKLYGTNSLDTIYSKDREKCTETIIKCFQDPSKPRSVILRKPLYPDKIVYTQWEFSLGFDKNEEPFEILCVGYDVSNEVYSKNEVISFTRKLKDNAIKYNTLFESTIFAINLHKPNGQIVEANKTFCNLVGVDIEDITKHSIFDFTPEHFWDNDKKIIGQLINESELITYHKEILNYDKLACPYEINKLIFHNDDNELFIWSVAKDISQLKIQKEAFEQQKHFLDQTTALAKVGGWEFDTKSLLSVWTSEVYNIYDVERSFNISSNERINYYHPEDRHLIIDAMNKVINTGERFSVTLRFTSAKHINKWLRITGEAVYINKKITSIKGIVQDISEKKEAEDLILKQNKLIKDAYYAQSHLIRLPIANIIGLIHLIDMVNDDRERYEIYQKINKSVHQLDAIIKDVAQMKPE